MHAYRDLRRPSRNLDLHPGINFSKLEVGGDIGGLVFAAGSVVAVLDRPALHRAAVHRRR